MTPVPSGALPVQLLRGQGPIRRPETLVRPRTDEDEESAGIRCPLCGWRPPPASLWSCTGHDPAEPGFVGCGMLWNTFATRGLCPGCRHRWRWTKCSECDAWSPHDDWYEAETG
jgi:DNA-directed RNA polymerase subunit RPC12/RpoP